MTEFWNPVAGFEDRYEVSSRGRVFSIARSTLRSDGRVVSLKRKERKPVVFGDDRYQHVVLFRIEDGRHVRVKKHIHAMVAEAFLGRAPDGHVCDHIDGNPTNNDAKNLRWVPHCVNTRKGRKAVLGADDVAEIRRLKAGGERSAVLAKNYSVTRKHINSIAKRDRWSADHHDPYEWVGA